MPWLQSLLENSNHNHRRVEWNTALIKEKENKKRHLTTKKDNNFKEEDNQNKPAGLCNVFAMGLVSFFTDSLLRWF